MTLKLLLQLEFYYPTVTGSTITIVSLLNGEGGSDKRRVVIHIIHSKFQFSSNMSLE
jgi:hypothetical protein